MLRAHFFAIFAAGSLIAGPLPANAVTWPSSLKVLPGGYPMAGDACRRIGETQATADYLDDSATLVGCPDATSAERLPGRVVGYVGGITLLSIPNGDTMRPGDGDGQGDATVGGTKYNATAPIPCTHVGSKSGTCPAGVTRSPDQIAIEIQLPNGRQRLLLFDGAGKFVTHGSAQADGSASLTSNARRERDWTIVMVGKEQYRIPDAFVLGD
jgi:hypothetical protein